VTPARLAELVALAAAREARDLARLEALASADRALEAELRELAGTYARDMAEGPAAAPLALLGKRLAWADRGARRLAAERAALAPRLAEARAAATVSLGKRRALERLLDAARRDAARAAEARAERDAPPRD
jgi:hypothetical protein